MMIAMAPMMPDSALFTLKLSPRALSTGLRHARGLVEPGPMLIRQQ
jgi:hypothetical protein